jgi:hypothetical protein
MVAAIATASIVPDEFAQSITALEVAIEAEAGITSVVDPGSDLVVSVEATASDAGTPAVYTIDLDGADGGTYALTVDGISTIPLLFSANDASVKAALESLSIVGEVTVATGEITFDDPVRDVAVVLVDIDLTNAGSPVVTEDEEGVAPDSSAAATAITDAIAAVALDEPPTPCQIAPGHVVEEFGDPVLSNSATMDAITLAEDEVATVTFATVLSGASAATVALGDVPEALGGVATLVDHGNLGVHPSALSAAERNQGSATLTVDPDDADLDGVYLVAVIVTDENGRSDYNIIEITITDPA